MIISKKFYTRNTINTDGPSNTNVRANNHIL